MSLILLEPLRELTDMQERFNQMFDEAFRGRGLRRGRGSSPAAWKPPVNIYETKDSVVLEVEIPGLEQQDIYLEVESGTLTIKGERNESPDEKRERWVRVERSHGAFERSFALPPTVDANGIQARLKNGILEVTLPKLPQAARRSVEIEGS